MGRTLIATRGKLDQIGNVYLFNYLPSLSWLYLGCLEQPWRSSRWWWSEMVKRHLASSPTIWMPDMWCRMASCPRTCCPTIWTPGLQRSMGSCRRACCPTIWTPGLRRSMQAAAEHVAQQFERQVCGEAWQAARQHAAPQLRTSSEHQGSSGPDLEEYESAAASADDEVFESSPWMKPAVLCILHLERGKVVARGGKKTCSCLHLVFILSSSWEQPSPFRMIISFDLPGRVGRCACPCLVPARYSSCAPSARLRNHTVAGVNFYDELSITWLLGLWC